MICPTYGGTFRENLGKLWETCDIVKLREHPKAFSTKFNSERNEWLRTNSGKVKMKRMKTMGNPQPRSNPEMV
jgi:hypothetical protein